MENYGLNALKNKKIYVYGLGINAKYICESVLRDSICGLIALEEIGGKKYGFDIFSLDDALKNLEVIIIAASKEVTKTIYNRIKACVPKCIPIYNMQGIVLNGEDSYKENNYWNNNIRSLKEVIKQHEIISFDCFDTVIMRRCLDSTDVFNLMEKRLKDEGLDYPIADWRIKAERKVVQHKPFYGIDDIYLEIKNENLITDYEASVIKKYELDLEYELVCPREVMVDILSFAVNNHKRVYILSDMYLPSDFIARLLRKAGIKENIIIWVSCEQEGSKNTGSLYKKLMSKEKGRSILHIGDNFTSDCLCAENTGVDSYYIMSGKAMLEASSASYLLERIFNNSDKLFLGLLVSFLFNDPFSLSSSKGKIQFKDIGTFAKCCFSAATLTYLSYIINQVLGKPKSKLLFVSRDGYFLKKLYDSVKVKYPDLELPVSIYFYSSRVAATGACCIEREDIKVLLSDISPLSNEKMKNILDARLHVDFDSSFDIPISHAVKQWGSEGLFSRVLKYEKDIYKSSIIKRQNYKSYLKKIGIESGDELFLVDLVSRGTVRYVLHRITGLNVHLIAMGGLGIPNAYCSDLKLASLQYGNIKKMSEFNDLFGFLELAYASHEGQLDSFDEAGNPVFVLGSEYNSNLTTEMQTGLNEIFDLLSNLNVKIWNLDLSYEFVVACMQMLYTQYSYIDEKIKDMFVFYNPLAKQSKINLLKNKV